MNKRFNSSLARFKAKALDRELRLGSHYLKLLDKVKYFKDFTALTDKVFQQILFTKELIETSKPPYIWKYIGEYRKLLQNYIDILKDQAVHWHNFQISRCNRIIERNCHVLNTTKHLKKMFNTIIYKLKV